MSDLSSISVLGKRTASQLPVDWYFDPRIYELEKRLLFDAGANYVGHELLTPETGDYHALKWTNGAKALEPPETAQTTGSPPPAWGAPPALRGSQPEPAAEAGGATAAPQSAGTAWQEGWRPRGEARKAARRVKGRNSRARGSACKSAAKGRC